jgi:histidinol dehydrogenase
MNAVRFTGRLSGLSEASLRVLFDRSFSIDLTVTTSVQSMVAQVRAEGDAALRRFALQFDKVSLKDLEVPRAECQRALSGLDPVVRRGLEHAKRNLERVARATLPAPSQVEVEPGLTVGRRADPFARVGVYAPGGKAAYPSSVLMGVVPARTAGVPEVLVCSPPGPSGLPSDVVLAAAELAGASRVFAVGGAGAIAAFAYGTEAIPRVDRIVGPGNAWVAEAKRQVAGDVGIDAPAGPSEIVVIAEADTEPSVIVGELLAQAEHDPDACVVALVQGDVLARAVLELLEQKVRTEPRRDTIAAALQTRGAVLSMESLDEAWPFAERFAAEHLMLAVRDTKTALTKVRNAGTVFLGTSSSVAFGDYVTGANHVLPTAGAARRFSGLSVLDFVRWQTWQEVTPAAAASLADEVEAMALSEGLPAHAAAASQWKSVLGAPESRPVPLRTTLEAVARYLPTRPKCAIDLTDNTNLFGAPPSVLDGLRDAAITRYPPPYVDGLRMALANEAQVPLEAIVTGCGSDDLLDAAMRAFAEPGEVLAYCPPTFGIVPTFARTNGVVPRAASSLSVEALLQTNPKIIYLCAPNNPTGALLPSGLLEELLQKTSAVVILDEAYIEYASIPSRVKEASLSERLIVIRTMSKAFGLAGMRVGWSVGPPRLMAELEKTRGPYKVGTAAEKAAITALTTDRAWASARVQDILKLRSRFVEALKSRGFTVLPSEANFVLVPLAEPSEAFANRMREGGVSVRAFPGLLNIGEAIRITIGPWDMMEACLEAMK